MALLLRDCWVLLSFCVVAVAGGEEEEQEDEEGDSFSVFNGEVN